jgi:ABC-type polysaccharide/polyol phosphate transport system ATPase subunit
MMLAVIEFDHVSKRFRLHRDRPRSFQELFLNTLRMQGGSKVETIWSLRDVSFSVRPGEMVGLVGPNGAGKSTALKLISRIIAPTHGRVLVQGKVTGLLELGAGFHPDLTGRENVYLNGAMIGMNRKQVGQRLEAIVAFAELEQFIDVPVKHYSSGMYMRLGFATAVYADVDVLLVDEVLAVGDQAFQSKCYQRINDLRCAGTTILFVSHDAATVRRMCDRAVFLDKGQVRSIGAADDVIADYMDYVWQERSLRDVQAQECTEQRWGSGEAVIEDVVFLAQDGNEQHVFRTGERFVARIHYQARQRVERPTFGVAIYRDDGAHVNGPNSVSDDYHIPAIEGHGQMDYIVEALPLLPGHYEFTAAIYDHSSTHPFDHRHRAFTFEVQPGPMGPREGIVHIPGTWEHRV